jgi:hypothetical protein
MSNNVVPLRPSGKGGLPTGDGSGYDGGMPPTLEARVNSLEQKVDRLIDDSREIKSTLSTLRDYLSELRGKVSQLPTWWQGLLGLLAVAGLVFAIARGMK